MQLLKELGVELSIVLTNDWFGGLASAFKRTRAFGAHFDVCL